VKKFFPSFFVCIISACVSFAQSGNDSTPKKPDSVSPRKNLPPKKDSVVQRNVPLNRTSDSLTKATQQPANGDSVLITKTAFDFPNLYLLFKTSLANIPDYNFLGKPQAQFMEEHRTNSNEALFYFFIGLLFYFGLIKALFAKYFENLIGLFVRASMRQQQIREQLIQTPLPSLLLNILFVITGSLYICFLCTHYHVAEGLNFWLLFLDCSALLLTIYVTKFMVLKLIGWTFNITKATDTYVFIVFMVNKIIGMLLLPCTIILFFSGYAAQEIAITVSLCIVGFLLIYRFIAAYPVIRGEIKVSILNFFLYLCAFEIAPLLLIYKVLLNYTEKAY
jgi:hypothetical protein